jgi:hypothetical protein
MSGITLQLNPKKAREQIAQAAIKASRDSFAVEYVKIINTKSPDKSRNNGERKNNNDTNINNDALMHHDDS